MRIIYSDETIIIQKIYQIKKETVFFLNQSECFMIILYDFMYTLLIMWI